MRPVGLVNPKNAAESSGGFKEGLVRIDTSVYKVHKGKSGEGQEESQPKLALVWNVTRLDEDKEPLTDEEDNPIQEEVVFSLGGKSLQHVRPGRADSADSEDIEDMGVEINAEGPTVFVVNQSWHPDKKSSIVALQESLIGKGLDLDRTWAPDYVGAIVYLKSKPSGQIISRPDKSGRMVDQTYSYKIVDKVEKGFNQASAKVKIVKVKTTSAANGKATDSSEVESKLKPIMDQISLDNTGKSMTKKALATTVNRLLAEHQVPPILTMPIMTLVRDDNWLTANGSRFDFSFNPADNQVSFA